MIPNSSSPGAFSTFDAGFDYFAREAHYRALAGRILAAVGGFSIVVVTGDPTANARLLSVALSDAAAPRHSSSGGLVSADARVSDSSTVPFTLPMKSQGSAPISSASVAYRAHAGHDLW